MKTMKLASALTRALSYAPQLRIGQLISNAVSTAGGPGGGDEDLFYMDNDALIRAVERYADILKEHARAVRRGES